MVEKTVSNGRIMSGALIVPFLISLTVLTILQRFSKHLNHEPKQESRTDLIPLFPSSFIYDKLKFFAATVSYAEPVLDQELIQWSLDYVEKIPEFKICFPQIRGAIVEFCSNNSTFISEFQYTIIALRVYNCLHLRSLGVQEIEFDNIEKNYKNFLSEMTKVHWNYYNEAYNLVRGLCLNERQYKTTQEIQDAVKQLKDGVDYYLNHTKSIRKNVYPSTNSTLTRLHKKFNADKNTMKDIEKMSQRARKHSETKLKELNRHMKNVIEESSLYSEAFETTVKAFGKNLRKLDHSLHGENSLQQLWDKFTQEYNSKTDDMEKLVAVIESKISQLTQLYHVKRV